MIAAICLLVPPLLLVYMREKVFQNHRNIYKSALSYAFFTLFLNSGIMLIRYAVSGISGNLFSQLNNYSAFACKYTILSVALALVEPYAEKFIRERVRWEVRLPRARLAFPYWRAAAVVYAAILFFLNFIRIFDNNFWGDEAFTTNLMTGTVSEIIATTAADVHPPLYYLIVKLGYALVGNRGWMFHLASLIPCAVILAFSLTAVWDRFGKETAIILMTLTTISGNAVTYNVEVRMYSWGALFILLSFYYLYLILTEGKAAHYVLFVVFSVAAAYTHYYCLLAVAFFYAALLFLSVFRKRLDLKKVLLTCACAVAAYLPWIAVFFNSMLKRVDGYWISSIPTFKESILYLFSSRFSVPVWICILVGLAAAFIYEMGILKIGREEGGACKIAVSLNRVEVSADLIWMIVGIVCVLGTIGVAILVSEVIRPFYVLRYIYPVSVVAWVVLGKALSRLKLRKVWALLLTDYMLATFLPPYISTYTREKAANANLQATLAATVDEIQPEDIIITNASHISWTIAAYYYPGVTVKQIDLSAFPELDEDICYWLFVSGSQDMEAAFQQMEEQGFAWEQVVDAGILGTHTVYIYQLCYEE